MDRKKKKPAPSMLWYAVPILFGIIGGIVSYFMLKGRDNVLARNLLTVGAVMFVIGIASTFLMYQINSSSYTTSEVFPVDADSGGDELACSYGIVGMKDVAVDPASSSISGKVENLGQIVLNDVLLIVGYPSGGRQTFDMGRMEVGESRNFQLPLSDPGFEQIEVLTNCENVSDFLHRSDLA